MWNELWKEADASNTRRNEHQGKRKEGDAHTSKSWVKERVLALAAEGQYSRACKALVSEGMSAFDEEIEKQLEEKHSQRGDHKRVRQLDRQEEGEKQAGVGGGR